MKSRFLALVGALSFAAAAHVCGGDGVPFSPKRVTIDYEFPYNDPKFKFHSARMVIEFQADEKGTLQWEFRYARPASFDIELGKDHLKIPEVILRDIHDINTGDLVLDTFNERIYLKMTCTFGSNYNRMFFVWHDGVLEDVSVEPRTRVSVKDRYPDVFKDAKAPPTTGVPPPTSPAASPRPMSSPKSSKRRGSE